MLIPGIIVCNIVLISTHLAHYFPGCHSPPVSDNELIAIIKAFNAEKHNPAAKLIWRCSICTKTKNAVNQQKQQFIAVKKATARQFAEPQNVIVIDDDDDDEIVALDGPSDVPKRNEATNPEVDPLSNTVPQRRSSNAASYDHIHPPPGRASGTKDKPIRIIDDPFLVPDFTPSPAKPPQTAPSTKLSDLVDLTISNDEGDGSDDALEYVTPSPTSKPVVEIVHEEVPQMLTSNDSNQDHPSPRGAQTNTSQLLTRWLNDRRTSVEVKPDIWARACLRRDQDATNKRNLGNKTAISSLSRRKSKPNTIKERSLTHPRATVFLSADEWLFEKQASLLLE